MHREQCGQRFTIDRVPVLAVTSAPAGFETSVLPPENVLAPIAIVLLAVVAVALPVMLKHIIESVIPV